MAHAACAARAAVGGPLARGRQPSSVSGTETPAVAKRGSDGGGRAFAATQRIVSDAHRIGTA
ncbi:hypothetical protein EYA88_15085 [Burkholderia pseudomallei]|nr:hypothetical protein EYA88_15085 [Burkholderia pseudomallei]